MSDYRRVSIMAVYWEKMIQDEEVFEHGVYERNMTNAENKLYSILCTLYTGLNQDVGPFVQRSAMSDVNRIVDDRTKRNVRDFVIARDTASILDSMSREYALILNSNDS